MLVSMNSAIRNAALLLIVLAPVSLLAGGFSGEAETSTAPKRHYYLTNANFKGNQTLNACASGYHFASMFELTDTSAITYNSSLGRANADDGEGPPVLVAGWIRTGYVSNSNPNVGGGTNMPTNCNAWTSGAAGDDGEVMEFDSQTGAQTIFGDNIACDNSQGYNIGVWCVEN